MKPIGAILLFLIICAVSLWLFMASVPALVHSITPELDQTILILSGLLALAVVWWFASGRQWLFAVIGWLILAVPFSAHALWQGITLVAEYRGARLPARMAIENYREAPIFWDGFDGPVGLTIEFDLVHPPNLDGFAYTPQIRMAPAYDIAAENLESSRTFAGGYFRDWHINEKVEALTLLKPVLFQRIYADQPADHDFDRFDASGRTHLVYRLHAGAIERLNSQDNICLASPSFGLPNCADDQQPSDGCVGKNTVKFTDVTYSIGSDISALWLATGSSFRNADLSGLLTETMRRYSSLQGNREAWAALQKAFEPAQLAAAGYRLCPAGDRSHGIGQICYCRF